MLWRKGFGGNRNSFTEISPAGKLPEVGKATTLGWFNGVNFTTVFTFEEDTFVGRSGDNPQASAVGEDFAVVLNEVEGIDF